MSKHGPKWSTVTIALGVIAAVAIAVPAFGVSGSIKKAIKKEVAKQVKNKTGPHGATGATGPQGPKALSLAFNQPETDQTIRDLGTVNELAVSASCDQGGPAGGRARLIVDVTSSVGGAELVGTNAVSENDTTVIAQPPIAEGITFEDQDVLLVLPSSDGFSRKSFVQATYSNSDRVISLQFMAQANDAAGTCDLHGTAVPASTS